MGVKIYNSQRLTGLTVSGTTDGLGVWNTINMASVLSGLPGDSTGILIKIFNDSSSTRWAGVRTNGKTNAHYHASMTGRSRKYMFVPFPAGSKLIDVYTQANTTTFDIVAVTDGKWTFLDIDAGLPTINGSGSTSTYTARTVSQCPANSVAITDPVRWRPTGDTATWANAPSGLQLVKINASQQFDIASTVNTTKIWGYCAGSDVSWLSFFATQETYTADSTWRPAVYAAGAGKKLLFLALDKSGTGNDIDFRMRGSSYSQTTVGGADNNAFAEVDASGNFDYMIETGTTGSLYVLAALPDYETYAANIASLTPLVSGSVCTIAFTSAFSATQVSISDGSVTKHATPSPTANPLEFTFTVPSWVDGATGLKYGAVSVSATNGTVSTPAFADTYDQPSGLSYLLKVNESATTPTATAVSYYNYGAAASPAFSPALKIGQQCLFDPDEVTLFFDLTLESVSGFAGVTTVWDRDPDSFITRSAAITISSVSAPVMPADTTATVSAGATVLGIYAATSGTAPITYTIGGANASLFDINASTGAVTFKSPATAGSGGITVTATNSAGSDSQAISYTVSAAAVGPVMPADTSVNKTEGDTTLGTFTATSGTAPITYSLSGANASLFDINASTGLVTFKVPAVVGSGSVTVTATNSAGSDDQVISFTVASASVAPVMPADASVSVYVGTTTLGTFAATSGTAPITYTLGGANASLFNINASTGAVTFKVPAVAGSGSITVTATNSTGNDSQFISYSVNEIPASNSNGIVRSIVRSVQRNIAKSINH